MTKKKYHLCDLVNKSPEHMLIIGGKNYCAITSATVKDKCTVKFQRCPYSGEITQVGDKYYKICNYSKIHSHKQ